MDWQPIETAPTDGTRILCYAPSKKRNRSLTEIFILFKTPYGWHTDPGMYVKYPTLWVPVPLVPK